MGPGGKKNDNNKSVNFTFFRKISCLQSTFGLVWKWTPFTLSSGSEGEMEMNLFSVIPKGFLNLFREGFYSAKRQGYVNRMGKRKWIFSLLFQKVFFIYFERVSILPKYRVTLIGRGNGNESFLCYSKSFFFKSDYTKIPGLLLE